MDTKKIGMFLGQLRREKSLTQEQLGEKLGVTNKTVSRWENGNYMPPVEMLQCLSDFYGVSINELLSGERLSEGDYREKAEANIKTALDNSAFTLKDKIKYFKTKWKKEHLLSTALCVAAIAGIGIYGMLHNRYRTELQFVSLMLLFGFLILRYNIMMAYVEGKAFYVPDTTALEGDASRKKALTLKRVRIAAMIILAVSILITADLAYNYFSSLVPEINDGITIRGWFAVLVFGEDNWSRLRYFQGFAAAMKVTVWLGAGNLLLACIDRKIQK